MHIDRKENLQSIQKDTIIPTSMANCCKPIMRPLSSGGAHSATYIGTIIDNEHTPIPTTNRPPRIAECPADVAVH